MENKITHATLKLVSEWLKGDGKDELNEISEQESTTESYINEMSVVDSEKLKVPYSR